MDSTIKLYQEYSTERPYVDDGHSYVFVLTISDTSLLKVGKTFDIVKDSSVLHCYYRFKSFWNKEKDKSSYSGTIEVLSVSSDKIMIQQNVIINSERKRNTAIIKSLLFFEGLVAFTKTNN